MGANVIHVTALAKLSAENKNSINLEIEDLM